MRIPATALCAFLTTAFLAACGTRTGLTLPPPKSTQPGSAQSAPAAAPAGHDSKAGDSGSR